MTRISTVPARFPALPGAVAGARFVGATTSGAPTTGTFRVGDYVVDRSGTMWVCTVAGSPGTWVDLSSGKELAYAEDKTTRTVNTTTVTDYGIASGAATLLISFPMPSNSRPVLIEAVIPNLTVNALNATPGFFLHFATPNRTYGRDGGQHTLTSQAPSYNPKVRIPLVGDYEPAAGDTVTCKLQWNTSAGSTATATAISTGNNRFWPFIRAVAQ